MHLPIKPDPHGRPRGLVCTAPVFDQSWLYPMPVPYAVDASGGVGCVREWEHGFVVASIHA